MFWFWHRFFFIAQGYTNELNEVCMYVNVDTTHQNTIAPQQNIPPTYHSDDGFYVFHIIVLFFQLRKRSRSNGSQLYGITKIQQHITNSMTQMDLNTVLWSDVGLYLNNENISTRITYA